MLPFGSTQLRCFQPAEYLHAGNYNVSVGQLSKSIPGKRRIIMIHKALLDGYTEKYIEYARARGCVVVYDTDDLIFEPGVSDYLESVSSANYKTTIPMYRAAMEACDVVLVATDRLRQAASRFHPDVRVMSNGLCRGFFDNADRIARQKNKQPHRSVTVAYLSGSAAHDRDFRLVEADLLQLLEEQRNIKVLLVGSLNFSSRFYQYGANFEYREFVAYERLPDLFAEIDINLIPLEVEQAFVQGKSELKFMEAGICGVPSVASPTELHRRVIEQAVSGLLVQNNQWRQAILRLAEDHAFREGLGRLAREYVANNYSPETRENQWAQLIDNIWERYGPARSAAHTPAAARLKTRVWLEWARALSGFKSTVGRFLSPVRNLVND